MADSIRISTEVLLETSAKLKNINLNLDGDLQEINKNMNALSATWQSDGAESIRAAINALKPRFEEYKAVVNSYADFLTKTAQSYETTEGSVQSQADKFK